MKSLIEVGDLAKPATTLIKKISSVVGAMGKPWQIERVARAEATEKIIQAETDIKVAELKRRAVARWIDEEAREQHNMEQIIYRADQLISERGAPDRIQDDWITDFFRACRTISDEETQKIWAKVLAGEADHPGSVSKRTVRILSEMDRADAVAFQAVAQRICRIGNFSGPIVSVTFGRNPEPPFQPPNPISRKRLLQLQSLGLIELEKLTTSVGFRKGGIIAEYFDYRFEIEDVPGIGMSIESFELQLPADDLVRLRLFEPDEHFRTWMVDVVEKMKKAGAKKRSEVIVDPDL